MNYKDLAVVIAAAAEGKRIQFKAPGSNVWKPFIRGHKDAGFRFDTAYRVEPPRKVIWIKWLGVDNMGEPDYAVLHSHPTVADGQGWHKFVEVNK